MSELFASPKVVLPPVSDEPVPQPEPIVEETAGAGKPLPKIRLIGFVETDGMRVILSVAGKLNVVAIGDSTDGIQVVAINPPSVTLKPSDEGDEFQINLFEQPWLHPPVATQPDGRPSGGRPAAPKRGSPAPVRLERGAPQNATTRSPPPGPANLPGVSTRNGSAPDPGSPGVAKIPLPEIGQPTAKVPQVQLPGISRLPAQP